MGGIGLAELASIVMAVGAVVIAPLVAFAIVGRGKTATCYACGRAVAAKAPTCPNCGVPRRV